MSKTKGRPAPPPEAPPPDPVAVVTYAQPPASVCVALAACFGSPVLCVRRIPGAASWLLKGDTVCTLVEGADHTAFVLAHLQQGPWGVVSVDADGEGTRVRVYALAPGEELRAALLSVWGTLSEGVAIAVGAQT